MTSAFSITALRPCLAFDSRGTPTVSCEVQLYGGAVGSAIVPSGASTGTHEAVEARDGGPAFGGRGVDRALNAIRAELTPVLHGRDVRDQRELDAAMRECDGTPDLTRLGANAVLAVSIASAIAGARAAGQQLWQWSADRQVPLLPLPMINIFSGGAHAGSALDVQDLLVVPVGAQSLGQALAWVWEVRHCTAQLLSERGIAHALVADEGGFGVVLPSTRVGLEILTEGIARAGLRPSLDVAIAIDVAANQLLTGDGDYLLANEKRSLSSAEMVEEAVSWCADFPVVSIEDLLAEDDWDGWRLASERLNHIQLLGDDLFVTNPGRLARGTAENIANAILVKPNQIGTLTAARDVVTAAHHAQYATVLSARSGETEDSWLADLAVGWRTGQIKVGSLTRSERTAKWNRLLRIADQLGDAAPYAGAAVLAGRTEPSQTGGERDARTGV